MKKEHLLKVLGIGVVSSAFLFGDINPQETSNHPGSFTANRSLKKQENNYLNFGEWERESLDSLIINSKIYSNSGERVDFISRRFLDIDYKAHTLVGGYGQEEKLVVNLEKMDCFTYLDYVMALAHSENTDDFIEKVKRVRYEDGKVDYSKRNHYLSFWLKNNPEYVDEVTGDVGNSLSVWKDLNYFSEGINYLQTVPVMSRYVHYIPSEFVGKSDLKNGDLVGFYVDYGFLDFDHMGIITKVDGENYLRHASSGHNKVVEVPLENYLKKIKRFKGISVFRPK